MIIQGVIYRGGLFFVLLVLIKLTRDGNQPSEIRIWDEDYLLSTLKLALAVGGAMGLYYWVRQEVREEQEEKKKQILQNQENATAIISAP